jgi:arylsulfatase A-like enzyme
MCTPHQWTKQVASHCGGMRNGTIVHWPRRITARGEIRTQFHHVIDVAPTLLQGVSMLYSFGDAGAAERHDLQYVEMFCNRGIYHQGWTAVTRHSTPWVQAALRPLDEDIWEPYGPDDSTQTRNLAQENPKKLAELQRLFLIEDTKYHVLPLDDRRFECFNPDLAGRSSTGAPHRYSSAAWGA